MADIRQNFRDDDRVAIPAVYPELSSDRILAMEHLAGRKITEANAFAEVPIGPREMAVRIANVYLQMGLIHGVFHADPHPGNLAVAADGSLLIYDFGMSESLPVAVQEDILRLYRALVRRDVNELVDALVALEVLEPTVDRSEVSRVLRFAIETLEGQSDVTWRMIIDELTANLRDFPFRIPPDVMLLIRAGTVSEGVCRQLDPEFDFLAVIRSFLVEHGLIERELEVLIGEVRSELQTVLPALLRTLGQLERTLDRLERGELVVRTEQVSGGGDQNLGDAIIAGALFVAASVLTLHGGPYELAVAAAAIAFAVRYLASHRLP